MTDIFYIVLTSLAVNSPLLLLWLFISGIDLEDADDRTETDSHH